MSLEITYLSMKIIILQILRCVVILKEEINLKENNDCQKCCDVASSMFDEKDKRSPWKHHFSCQV